MKSEYHVSKSVISRLPRYYRFLGSLSDEGITRVSSNELSEKMGLTASQIRQDFNCFGGFGQQGYGYNVEQLRTEIGKIIGINGRHKTILIGAGNLGKAIASHIDFNAKGFELCGIFDSDISLRNKVVGGVTVLNTSEIYDFCKEKSPVAAILCVPESAGKEITEILVANGIKFFWNFSHYNISADFPDVTVENVHLNDSLMTLCYSITNAEEKKCNE